MTEYVYKLKNGKVVSAYADEKGNISITKEALEIMVNSWNVGYQKGYSDGCLKSRTDAIKEFAEAYKNFMNESGCNIHENCIDGDCIDCFKDEWLKRARK